MSRPRQKFISDQAAEKALKKILVDLVRQLNLFDTMIHLHAMDGLTDLETEKLQNFALTESERKQYLLTSVIPSKGHYKGMTLLMRALKQSKQFEILKALEKAYEDAVNVKITEKLGFSHSPEVKHKTEGKYHVQTTASDCCDSITSVMLSNLEFVCKDPEGDKRRHENFTGCNSSSSDDDEGDDDNGSVILLDSPQEQPQPQSCDVVSIHSPVQAQSDSVSLHNSLVQQSGDAVYNFPVTVEQSSDDISYNYPVTAEQADNNHIPHDSPVTVGQKPQLQSNDIGLQSPVTVEQQPHPYVIPLACNGSITALVAFRPRANHFCYSSNPYKDKLAQHNTCNAVPVSSTDNHGDDNHVDCDGTTSNTNVN